jgi:hypothetical protein
MTPLLVAFVALPLMQVADDPLAPSPAPPPPAPQPAPPPVHADQQPAQPAGAPGRTWERPYWQPPAPGAPAPGSPAAPSPPAGGAPAEEERVTWFARLELGLGSQGFSENSSLLNEMGYGGVKMWVTIDGAWMFHERVGAGLLLGMNRQSSQPENSTPSLDVVSYFACVEVPILLVGNRSWAFYLTPRGGYAGADIEFDNDREADLLHTGTFGGAFTFSSFRYHIGATLGFMRTPTGAPGEAGRPMDFGGIYGAIAGTIDG